MASTWKTSIPKSDGVYCIILRKNHKLMNEMFGFRNGNFYSLRQIKGASLIVKNGLEVLCWKRIDGISEQNKGEQI